MAKVTSCGFSWQALKRSLRQDCAPAERARVKAHLETCDRCVARLGRYTATDALRILSGEDLPVLPEPSAGFDDRMRESIKQTPRPVAGKG